MRAVLACLILAGCPAADDGPEVGEQGSTGGDPSTGPSASTGDVDPTGPPTPPSGSESSGSPEPGTTSGGTTSGPGGSSGSSTGENSESSGEPPSAECTEYCDEFIPNCSEIPGVEVYDDLGDCLSTCAGFDHGGLPGGFAGDTVQCRVAHLTFEPDPGPGYYELHCFHAQEHPQSQCV